MIVSIFRDRCRLLSLCLLSASVLVQLSYAAASGSLRGKVLDKETGAPLPGATVLVQNTTIGAPTDPDGKYVVHGVPSGAQSIRVSYVGYVTMTMDVTIPEDGTLELDVRLVAQAVEGETVIVLGQARGQKAAINQQLASNTITNIVAADRIREMPDASAAESIGRLPGVSIDRYNGEATAVGIRGLAPKYNTVTVNGVALPATNNNDRSVDLSLISSNLLDGIEVKKANTPDMDADALGGTIDLRLKEAPDVLQVNATVQGGYSRLPDYYGNYSTYVSLSNRFLDNDLGIIAGFNADRNNRTADKLNASYGTASSGAAGSDIVDLLPLTQMTRRREEAFKSRIGGNLLMDYRIPYGKVTGNGFYSQAKTDGTYREDQLSWSGGHNTRYYNSEQDISTTSIFTGGVGVAQDFGWMKYDFGVSATGSKTDDPNDNRWQFAQEDAATNGQPTTRTPLIYVDTLQTPDSTHTGLKSIFTYSRRLIESQKVTQLNLQIPLRLTDDITGYVKAGGKLRWLTRTFNQEQWGHDNLQYGNGWNGVNSDLVHALAQAYPNDFNLASDSALISQTGKWNLYRFFGGYKVPSNFLGGQYHGFGESPDLRLMNEATSVLRTLGPMDWQRQSIGSLGYDYDGIEQYQAGYLMAEINVGPLITILPGVRYDADYTKYHGQTFQEVTQAGSTQPPAGLTRNENVRSNHFLLPMVHVKLVPFEWLRIHLAGTETVTRPDYNMYAPITTMDQYSYNIQAANGSLRDSRSKNLDVSVSIYQNYLGFISVSGFYKKIDDLILYASIQNVDTTVYRLLNANLNVPFNHTWLSGSNQVNTWLNNPSPAQYRGVEFDWQTNFWYLPSVFKGLIFDLNWTFINSTITVKHYNVSYTTILVRPHVYQIVAHLDSTSRTNRMPDQPAHILNATIGYDFMGFSIRASYLYQSNKVAGIGDIPWKDSFTSAYGRWDLSMQQRITSTVQVYANLNNLNNRHDENLLGYRQINPTSLEYYGTTIDVGLRIVY